MAQVAGQRYRADGVRITHDPYAPGMAEKYGQPGETDNEGFDPYADSVGPGIYSGIVARDEQGQIVVGKQYQNHNPNPGPVCAPWGLEPTTDRLEPYRSGPATYACGPWLGQTRVAATRR